MTHTGETVKRSSLGLQIKAAVAFCAAGMTRKGQKTGKPPKRQWITVPMTEAQKKAVVKAARKIGLDPAAFSRSAILQATDYDPERDEPTTA